MGIVYTEITLKNATDANIVQRGLITEQEVRGTRVRALVDTGAGTLIISEELRQTLGLTIKGLRGAELADGTKHTYQVTEPVEIHWQDRMTACPALVLPGTVDILLGAIPLEDMDLIVDPVMQEVKGAHGDEVICMIK
ncbi:MAG: retroviral-like aspartic protease family protein [Treponema sp.]|nr:retroviral-like aspartic protease family protein [Treponema sp.]